MAAPHTLPTLRSPAEAAGWLRQRVSGELRVDSRQVGPGDGFLAWPGAAADARRFVPTALRQGASACLVEQSGVQTFGFAGEPAGEAPVAAYPRLKAAAGPIAAAYFGEPSAALDVLAVTGTNGKTSCTWWLAQALSKVKLPLPIPCGLVGTLGLGTPSRLSATGLTTPEPVLLQRELRRFVQEGLRACAIEASSIGLAEHRLEGTRIRVAVFTNFTQDHLDYHGGMQAYWQAKAGLFRWPGLHAAVLNIDDPQGASLAGALAGSGLDLWSVSCRDGTAARLRALELGHDARGLRFVVAEGQERHALQTTLLGEYNAANLLGVLGAMRALGVPLAEAVRCCRALPPVPGRMDCLAEAGQPLVAVDYAHTPAALALALAALRPLARQRGGNLWCVFGCGGGRDPAKRPLMAAEAARNADEVVVTSDNPRHEKPEAIIDQILSGLSRQRGVSVEPDRALAIAGAIARASAPDVVLLAGKGHEEYQESAGVKRPFSDKEHARRALARRQREATP